MKSLVCALIGLSLPLASVAFADAPKAPPAKPTKVDGATATTSTADDAACPPGAFCEPAEPAAPPAPTPSAPPEQEGASQVAHPEHEPGSLTVHVPPPPPGADPSKPRVVVIHPGRDGRPEQVVVYEDGEAPPHLGSDAEPPPPPPPYQFDGRRRGMRDLNPEWGLTLRASGALMGSARVGVENFGLGGVGVSLRRRPLPPFAVDFGIDILGGVDPNGWTRREVPFSASTLFFVNPLSRAQVYLLGGVNLTFAEVQSEFVEANLARGNADDYTYLGMQFGGGVEFRLTPLVGFFFDGFATVRTRIDDDVRGRYPEYYDARTGLASNSSTVGQLRTGLTLWW